MMTFKQLRSFMRNHHRKLQLIRWNKSGIVECASLNNRGVIYIQNIVTNKVYKLPEKYNNLDITPIELTEKITPGSLLPKNMR